MSNYNKIIFTSILFFILMVIFANLFISDYVNGRKYYLVEINRAYNDIVKDGFANISDYNYIKDIQYLPMSNLHIDTEGGQINNFFNNGSEPYIIKTLETNEGLTYIKFTYVFDFKKEYGEIRTIVNIVLMTMFIIVFVMLIYIKIQIIKPFHEICEMPYELSRGHLTKNLKENKNRFFGRFIWGLDMLRENLEENKLKQLALEKEKKTLILSISHDIKTPLSAIKLYGKALTDHLYIDKEKQLEVIEKINSNAEQIEGFVNDIIKTSKEDFLGIEVKNSEYYLNDLMQRINDYYIDKTEYLKINFVINKFDNCLLYGDLERSIEVFENVIENAVKYGDGKNIEINFGKEDNCCLVTVTNTGNTLSENELVHVFDSFWRGSNVMDKKGSGLGLYICRQILTKMKGDIFAGIDGEYMKITVVLKMI